MKVVVGLGNPGREYESTRHNIGWLLLDRLAQRLGAGSFRREKTMTAAEAFYRGEKIYLLKPQSYMNLSGRALAEWLSWFSEIREAVREAGAKPRPEAENGKADGEDVACVWPGLLVLTDDVNLPLGRLRLRPGGSSGGHNGLADIEKALGGRGFPRLRLGVSAPPAVMDRADYVLGRFAASELPILEAVLPLAAEAAEMWMRDGLEKARNLYNGKIAAV